MADSNKELTEAEKLAQALRGLNEQPTFGLFMQRIQAVLNTKRAELETPLPPEATQFLRGEIQMLRGVLMLPGVMIDEAEGPPERKRRRR